MTVAVLFVDPTGHYPDLPAVDCWDAQRDALRYEGPHPVVAHPPCQLWTNLAAVNFKRYGGEHNRPGNDGGCFRAAVNAVLRFGGVLEHPAFSQAWLAHGIRAPIGVGWNDLGHQQWTCEVWQSAYGHLARKRTWLFYVGPMPLAARWERPAGTHQCGWFDRIKPTLSKKAASRTPIEFARWLVALAEHSRTGGNA